MEAKISLSLFIFYITSLVKKYHGSYRDPRIETFIDIIILFSNNWLIINSLMVKVH